MPTQQITDDSNLNPLLSRQNYNFVLEKYRDLPFSIVAINLPDISLGQIERNTPFYPLKDVGTSLHYTDLSLTFHVDENMSNYISMYRWLHAFKEFQVQSDSEQTIAEQEANYDPNDKNTTLKSDAMLYVLSNKKNPKVEFHFKDCFPTSLGGISFSTKSGIEIVTCDMTLKYNNFTVKAIV